MSDSEAELAIIHDVPPANVSSSPDDRTERALHQYDAAELSSQSGLRSVVFTQELVGSLKLSRDQSRCDYETARSANADLRKELDHLRPKLSALEQAEITCKMNGGVGAICVLAGALLLSVASFCTQDVWKWIFFTAGVSLSVVGALLGYILRLFNWPKRGLESPK